MSALKETSVKTVSIVNKLDEESPPRMTFGKLVNNLFIEKDHNRPQEQEPLTKSTNDRTVTRSVSTKENTVSSRGSRNIFSKKRTN